MEYLIRIERMSRELVLSFTEPEEPRWREAARKLFSSAQDARGEAIRLAEAAPEWIVATFEKWGCKLPEELRAPRARIRRS